MFLDSIDLFDDKKIIIAQKFINSIPISIGVKDFSSQYLMGNNFFTDMIGILNNQTLKGRYDNEINCISKQIAHLLMAEDALAMKQKRSFTILTYASFANNKSLLLYGKKYPIINEKGATLGCGFCFQDVTTSQLINLAPILSLRKTAYGNRQLGNQFSYIIAESIPEYGLSNRQIECLFHILRGQSANDVAIALNISKRTVETHIDAIKDKLGCDTKTQLIDKALSAGLLNYIPSRFIQAA